MQTKNSLLELRWRETRTVSSFHFRILYKLTPEVTLLITFSVASQNDVASFPSPLARALAHFKANELTEFKPASSTSDCNNNHIPTTWNVSLPLTTQMNFYYNVCNNISLTMQPIQIYDMKCCSAGLPLSSGFYSNVPALHKCESRGSVKKGPKPWGNFTETYSQSIYWQGGSFLAHIVTLLYC